MIDLERRRRVMSRSLQLGHCICNPKQKCPCEIFKEKNVCLCAGEKFPEEESEIRLTQLVENAGCASKINQADLKEILANLPEIIDPRVIVGASASDDAGIFALNDELALVQTVDVFTPNVDDPYIFGQIAAANSVSDVYAMGGRPLTALSIISFPIDRISKNVMEAILRGGIDKLKEAETIVLGGHSIKDEEIKFGFAVTGLINPKKIVTNKGAQPGDILILTKPLGTGVLSFAHQLGRAPEEGLRAAIKAMTELNRAAAEVMISLGVKVATDITGFGLIGHLSELVANQNITAIIEVDRLPVFPGVIDLLRQGIISGAAERNREYAASFLIMDKDIPEEFLYLACDPQTSGGLLMAVAPEKVNSFLAALEARGGKGFIIGQIESGNGKIILTKSSQQKISDKNESFHHLLIHEQKVAPAQIISERELASKEKLISEELISSGQPRLSGDQLVSEPKGEFAQKLIEEGEKAMEPKKEKSTKSRPACCPGGPPSLEELMATEKSLVETDQSLIEKEKALLEAPSTVDEKAEGAPDFSSALDLENTPAGEKFLQFIQETMKSGALSLREKELIAISLAALSRCEPCFEAHLEKAKECGLKEEEIREALSMATMFGGATVLMFIEAVKEKLGL